MTAYTLRLFRDRIGAGETASYEGATNRVLYCRFGGLILSGTPAEITCDGAYHATAPITATGTIDGAIVWRFELIKSGEESKARVEGTVSSELLITHTIQLESPHGYLIRCDAVNFPLDCEIYEHLHAGPGIRCIHHGSMTLQIDGTEHVYMPNQAWFELGTDPVSGRTAKDKMSGFVRVMILPRTHIGKSSISYLREQDWEKPKRQTYKTYIDQFIEL